MNNAHNLMRINTMRTSNWQNREAARLGNNRAIDTAADEEIQRKARELRAENARRTATARSR